MRAAITTCSAGHLVNQCDGEPIPAHPSGITGGYTNLTYRVAVSGASPWSANVNTNLPRIPAIRAWSPTIYRSGAFARVNDSPAGSAMAVFSVGSRYATVNAQLSGNNYLGATTIGGQVGGNDISLRLFAFDDGELDVNGDLRFNVADASTLQQIVTLAPSHPAYIAALARWDFDNNSAITAADVDVLGGLVNIQVDSGVFGDVDRNGSADCTSISTHHQRVSSTLGLTNFEIELDFDLDGEIEQSDWQRFIGSGSSQANGPCFVRGDMDCSGHVSVGDNGPFTLALTNPTSYATTFPYCDRLRGDMNGDGQLTVGDIGLFTQCVSSGGCQ